MQILGTWDQGITHIKTWPSGVWSGQPLGFRADPLALSVCFLAFGMWIHLIVIDSLSSSRGKGKDGVFSALFPSVGLPYWPTATGLEVSPRMYEQGNYYL